MYEQYCGVSSNLLHGSGVLHGPVSVDSPRDIWRRVALAGALQGHVHSYFTVRYSHLGGARWHAVVWWRSESGWRSELVSIIICFVLVFTGHEIGY